MHVLLANRKIDTLFTCEELTGITREIQIVRSTDGLKKYAITVGSKKDSEIEKSILMMGWDNTRVTPAILSEVIMPCPLCDSEKIKSLGPVRTPLGIFERMECETCGEKFNIDDKGNEVQTTKCEYSGTECELASIAHEDDPALGMECLAVHPSQCPDNQAIEKNVQAGHTYHCACRLQWGDGECECKVRS